MAQVVSEAILRARVEGEGDVKALNKAFQDLGKTSGKSASGVGDAMVSARARKAGLDAVGAALSGATAGMGKAAAQPRLITRMRTAIGNLLGSAASSIRSGAGAMGGFAGRIGSGIGAVASKVGQGVAAVARFGVAAGGIALRVTGVVAALGAVGAAMGGLVTVSSLFIGVLRSMTSAFRFAVDEAAAAIDTFAKMRRTGADWNTVENRSALAQRTIGDGWEEINNRIIKTFTPSKMAKGLMGDKTIFQRWGITPAKVQDAERRLGRRMDVTDWMQRFASQREAFDAQIAKFGDKSPKQRAAIEKRRAQLDDDVTKMFGPAFAESILKWSTADMRRILESQDRAGAVGPQNLPGETDQAMSDRRVQQAKDLQIAIDEMTRTFGELTSRIAVGVQPAVTNMVEAWTQLAQSDASQKIADLVTSMANKGFETVIAALNSFDPSAIVSKIQGLQDWFNSFNTASVGESLGKFATSLLDLPEKLGAAATAISDFITAIMDFAGKVKGLYDSIKSFTDIPLGDFSSGVLGLKNALDGLVGMLPKWLMPNKAAATPALPLGGSAAPAVPSAIQNVLEAPRAPPVPIDQGMFDQIFDQGGSTLRGAASDMQTSLAAGGSEAAGAFNAGMTFAGADAAGTRLGQAAVAVISAGVSGMRIGIAPGPMPSMVRSPMPSVGADSPVTP